MSVLSFAAALLVGFALGFVQAQTKTYTVANNYTGSVFFEGWDYAQGVDTKNLGSVLYQGAADAKAQNLTYINNVGNAIIKIDNTTANNSTTYGRASVQISTQAAVNQGSLILFQARHIPYGCSVWPGFRTLGANGTNWPQYGEMDIIEEVNLATFNQYSLHTTQGCTHPYTATGGETGTIGQTDCWNATNFNQGCIIVENKPNNFGQGFAQNGGGAYAVLWNDDGIKFWFFPRSGIPSDFTSTSPNPANWGPPSAFYPQSTCNTTKFFGPQSLMLDLDICGRYAGAPGIFNSGNLCQGLCTNFVQNPRNYDQAYFEIEFLSVFVESQSNGTITPPIPSPTQSNSAPTSATSSVHKGNAYRRSAPIVFTTSSIWVSVLVGFMLCIMSTDAYITETTGQVLMMPDLQ